MCPEAIVAFQINYILMQYDILAKIYEWRQLYVGLSIRIYFRFDPAQFNGYFHNQLIRYGFGFGFGFVKRNGQVTPHSHSTVQLYCVAGSMVELNR